MEKLDKLISLAKESSRRIIESGEEHGMILIALTPEGNTIAKIAMPEKAKPVFKLAITQLLAEMNAYVYATKR